MTTPFVTITLMSELYEKYVYKKYCTHSVIGVVRTVSEMHDIAWTITCWALTIFWEKKMVWLKNKLKEIILAEKKRINISSPSPPPKKHT